VRFYELGLQQPRLQVLFYSRNEGKDIYRADAIWDCLNAEGSGQLVPKRFVLDDLTGKGERRYLLFEFDGKQKYQDDEEDALKREIARERVLTLRGFVFMRFEWKDLLNTRKMLHLFGTNPLTVPRLLRHKRGRKALAAAA